MQNIESYLPDEREYWRDFEYHFYTLKNPKYHEALKESERVRQQAREVFGRKMEQVTSTVALIGDPIEKARAAPPAPFPVAQLPPRLQLDDDRADDNEDPLEPIDLDAVQGDLNQEEADKIFDQFLGIVKDYRNRVEKGLTTSILTATIGANRGEETITLGGIPLEIVVDDTYPNEFYVDVIMTRDKPVGMRFNRTLKALYLFASENIRNTIAKYQIPSDQVRQYALLMQRTNLLQVAEGKKKGSAKAKFLREVLNAGDVKSPNKGKKKERDTSSSSGAGLAPIEYYSGPDELVERLALLIQSIGAGNNSKAIKNEGMSLLTKLQASGSITRKEFNQIMYNFL